MRKILPIVAILVVSFSLACRPETGNRNHNEPGNANSTSSGSKSRLTEKKQTTQRTKGSINIYDGLKFNDEKPAVLSVINSEKLNLKVVGLKKDQIMSKHKAGLKSLVIVLEGKIEFVINDETFQLGKFDTYEIPVNVEHEIRGIEKSIFSLTQEK